MGQHVQPASPLAVAAWPADKAQPAAAPTPGKRGKKKKKKVLPPPLFFSHPGKTGGPPQPSRRGGAPPPPPSPKNCPTKPQNPPAPPPPSPPKRTPLASSAGQLVGEGNQHQLLDATGPAAPASPLANQALAGARRGAAAGVGQKTDHRGTRPGAGSAEIEAITRGAPGADDQNCRRQGVGRSASGGIARESTVRQGLGFNPSFHGGREVFGVRPSNVLPPMAYASSIFPEGLGGPAPQCGWGAVLDPGWRWGWWWSGWLPVQQHSGGPAAANSNRALGPRAGAVLSPPCPFFAAALVVVGAWPGDPLAAGPGQLRFRPTPRRNQAA